MTEPLSFIHRRLLGERKVKHYHPEVQAFLEAEENDRAIAEAEKRAQARRIKRRAKKMEELKRRVLSSRRES